MNNTMKTYTDPPQDWQASCPTEQVKTNIPAYNEPTITPLPDPLQSKNRNFDRSLSLIDRWQLSHTMLAAEIGMPRGTFARKIAPNQHKYKFTQEELTRIAFTIQRIKADL